jgi:transcriptional regulator with XRE-family HTH domain
MFGRLLREHRVAAGFTQEQLAEHSRELAGRTLRPRPGPCWMA